jgi:hypothetical protein
MNKTLMKFEIDLFNLLYKNNIKVKKTSIILFEKIFISTFKLFNVAIIDKLSYLTLESIKKTIVDLKNSIGEHIKKGIIGNKNENPIIIMYFINNFLDILSFHKYNTAKGIINIKYNFIEAKSPTVIEKNNNFLSFRLTIINKIKRGTIASTQHFKII